MKHDRKHMMTDLIQIDHLANPKTTSKPERLRHRNKISSKLKGKERFNAIKEYRETIKEMNPRVVSQKRLDALANARKKRSENAIARKLAK